MFQFKFRAVLDYRRLQEDTCQQNFAASRLEWLTQQQRLEMLYALWKKYMQEWRSMQQGTVSVWALELYQRYMLTLRDEIEKQALVVRQCLDAMEQRREELLTAAKDKKIMEKLQEYHAARYKKEQRLKETKVLDDVAGQRHMMKGRKS